MHPLFRRSPDRAALPRPWLAGAALALLASTMPGRAGPCTAEIEQMQAKVDARIDAMAEAGPPGPESLSALQHRQPTPGSIARAERQLSGDSAGVTAVAALKRAREADGAGDAASCEAALAAARRAIDP